MLEPSPSAHFRGVALLVVAGVILASVVLLIGGSVGFSLITGAPSGPGTDDQTDLALVGATGALPQSSELNQDILLQAAAAGELDPGWQVVLPPDGLIIPPLVLHAYLRAESVLAEDSPDCHLQWPLLAGLGRVISDHAHGELEPDGTTAVPILGPRLDGRPGHAKIVDSDGGRWDGDPEWDRAAGPFQVIPAVWRRVGADSDGNGAATPHNIYDAALAAGRYLCEDDADLRDGPGQARAVFRYQRSETFMRATVGWARAYAGIPEESTRAVASSTSLPVLPPLEEVLPLPATPPPPGRIPQGPPQPPVSLLPEPSPTPGSSPQGGGDPTSSSPGTTPPSTTPPPTTPPRTTPPSTTPPSTTPPSTTPPSTTPPSTTPPSTTPPSTTPPSTTPSRSTTPPSSTPSRSTTPPSSTPPEEATR